MPHTPAPDPVVLVPLLEEHLADLNTALALNTMALAAFGITPANTMTGPTGIEHGEEER